MWRDRPVRGRTEPGGGIRLRSRTSGLAWHGARLPLNVAFPRAANVALDIIGEFLRNNLGRLALFHTYYVTTTRTEIPHDAHTVRRPEA